MMITTIIRNSQKRVSKNFLEREFFTKCPDYTRNTHILDSRLIFAVQVIRNFISEPVFITSSYRTFLCNQLSGGAPDSFHLKGMALDFMVRNHKLVADQIRNCDDLFSLLYSCGIKGFGIYKGHFHIDTRQKGAESYGQYDYTLWDNG